MRLTCIRRGGRGTASGGSEMRCNALRMSNGVSCLVTCSNSVGKIIMGGR